jgi:hypothetical protein
MVSRLLYAPPYLYFFDNANFALAIDRFDPGLHQPQPPGYPLFVALLKLLHRFLPSANHSLIAAGLIGSAAGLVLVWLWAARMFGERAAWAAAALLLFNPVFWVAGVANPVRTFLVVIAAACAIASWRSMTTERDPRPWFYATSGTLGFLAGFRPECLLLLLPLWAATGWFRRIALRTWAIGTAVLGAAALIWIAPLMAHMGGAGSILGTFATYLRATSQRETLVFGATGLAAFATARRVLVWNFGLAAAWVWAVPLAIGSLRARWSRAHTVCLLFSFVPPFLFHSLIYVRDVDQTLITVAVMCVMGGAVLTSLRPWPAMLAAVAVAVLLTGWNFRWPLFPEMVTASRGAMRFTNNWNRSTFSALEALRPGEDTVLVWDDSVVSWRQVSYYYPTTRLLALEIDPPLWIVSQVGSATSLTGDAIVVAGARYLVVGASYQQANELAHLPGAERRGPLVVLPWGPESQVKVGRYILRAAP